MTTTHDHPQIGQTARGHEIGRGRNNHNKYVYAPCVDCGVPRWVITYFGKPHSAHCPRCGHKGRLNGRWKGEGHQHGKYKMVYLPKTSPFYSMTNVEGMVGLHRLLVAQEYDRPLTGTEFVHHINGDTLDNRIENLELVSPANHGIYNRLCCQCATRTEIRLLKQRIQQLEAKLGVAP